MHIEIEIRIRFLRQRKIITYFLFNLIALLILLSLGVWQLERLQWKNKYINEIKVNIGLPAIEINKNNYSNFTSFQYRKAKIFGHYLYDKQIYIHSKVHNKVVGIHLIVPFKTSFGTILVNRGFVPKNDINYIKQSFDKKVIIGLLDIPSKKAYFTPTNDIINNDWYYINIKDIEEFTELNLLKYILVEENNLIEKFPIGSQYNINIPNDHLQYAFTWFSLALVLCIFVHIIWRKYD